MVDSPKLTFNQSERTTAKGKVLKTAAGDQNHNTEQSLEQMSSRAPCRKPRLCTVMLLLSWEEWLWGFVCDGDDA